MVTALLHRAAGGELVIEMEDAAPAADLSAEVERALETIISAGSLASLCDATAQIFKEITGYDRVMIYRFDEEGHGEVFAETRKPELEAFLGNRYPASDIPADRAPALCAKSRAHPRRRAIRARADAAQRFRR